MVFLWTIDWMKNEFSIVVYTWNCRFASVLYYYIKKRPSKAWPSNYFSRNYFLVSLKTTCLRNFGEYFFNSKRSGLLRLFLLVKYKRSPVSAHSNKMLIRMNDTSHFQIDSITHRFFYDLPVYNNKILDTCQWLYYKFQIILLVVKLLWDIILINTNESIPLTEQYHFIRNKIFHLTEQYSLMKKQPHFLLLIISLNFIR